MKSNLLRTLVLSSALCLMSFVSHAQWVSIPDTAFGSYLKLGYPACIQGNSTVGWQMDTTCNAVVNATTVYCVYKQVENFTGIQYFDNLDTFVCVSNHFDTMPDLPKNLLYIAAAHSHIRHLPSLPTTLTYLDVCDNNLSFIPPLPAGIRQFYCHYNYQLTSLPPLPASLRILFAYGNQFSSLPALPDSITYIDCSYNNLTSLPAFSNSLQYVNYSHNNLTSIPELPDTIQHFDCSYNMNLRCLPKLTSINQLYFDHTSVTCIPNMPRNNSLLSYSSPIMLCGFFNTNGCDFYKNVSGNVYVDGNTDCVRDLSENGVGNVKVSVRRNGNTEQSILTDANGYYFFATDSAGVYELSVDTSGIPFSVSCPANNILYDTILSFDSLQTGRDFAMGCKPGFDLAPWSIVAGRLRAGTQTFVDINAGDPAHFLGLHCAGGVSGQVKVVISGPVTYMNPAAGALTPVVNGDTLTYSVADFSTADFFHDFNFVVYTATSAVFNSDVCFTVTVSTGAVDNNPANDTITQCFKVVGSYDPNEKEVYPAGDIEATQKWLTYTIQFQNTGTDTAIHIYLTDTLSQYIDENSFQLLAYSHQPTVYIKQKAVQFNFPNINLPDSNINEPLSHGYVQYKVKLKDSLAIGTNISNTAFIYFDFNAPVVTNTTHNVIKCYAGTSTTVASACGAELFYFYGTYLDTNGVYSHTLHNIFGCDSVIELSFTRLQSSAESVNAFICNGEQYQIGTVVHTTAGVFSDTLQNMNGCDSVVTISLTVFSAFAVTVDTTIAPANSYTLPSGNVVSAAGVYYDTLRTINNCDSIIKTNLDVVSSVLSIKSVMGELLHINPNPASESVMVTIDESMIGSNLIITDITGRTITNYKLRMTNVQLPVNDLANGVYLVTVENEKGKVTKKLIKQ